MHVPLNGDFNIPVSVLNCNEKALITWFPAKFIKKNVFPEKVEIWYARQNFRNLVLVFFSN